ncbi:transglycosylase domain-containing protein, partial [Staphylococcus epidermidis]|uniref:transglycosylase domain-containing protein n=1 Tax=Staphylococcus epidermidis TaxID=1282 RepID=UPI0016436A68
FVATQNIPNYLKPAFISIDHEPFYKHHRFHIKPTTTPFFSTITDRHVQSASTITQQLLNNYYYHNQPSFTTKIKQFFLPPKLQNQY